MAQISRICPWINSFSHSREPLFTPEDCKEIINYGLNNWIASEAEIEKSGNKQGHKLDLDYRNVTVFRTTEACIPDSYEWGFTEKIYNNIWNFNQDVDNGYGFDIEGMLEPPMLMKYEAPNINKHNIAGKYDWHLDIGSDDGMSTRKLAYTLHLNSGEFEGGELQWLLGNEPSYLKDGEPKIGTMSIFPTYLLHRVTPVTSGIRYALVGWIHGDSFR